MPSRPLLLLYAVCLSLLVSTAIPSSASALISVAEKNARAKQYKVVLDPGHGGIDHGTSFEGKSPVAEKDLTLMLARQVATELKKHGIHVYLTRDGDYEMPLAARTAMANQLGADLFLSIHLNAIPGPNGALARGAETYILNHETDSTSKRLAQLENQVIGSGPEQQGDVALILKDLRLDATLPESKRFACMIQDQVSGGSSAPGAAKNRGVRQALFFVLLGADMPSALVEAGFLNNTSDREKLLSLAGQKAFAHAVSKAILSFRAQKNTPLAQRTLNTCKVH
jgi:N-acetylmuramoyl-L-alanine amidase